MNTLRRAGIRHPVAYLCIAAVLAAAVIPGVAAMDSAIPEPGWMLLPDLATPTAAPPAVAVGGGDTAAVLSPPGRAPPALLLHA